MGQTYYDSTLTDEQIQAVLDAIDGLIVPANNGKAIAVSGGKLVARSVQWGGGYPEPTGTITLTENGLHDVKDYAAADVQVQGSSAVIQPLSADHNGTFTPPTGVDGYALVTVNVPTGSGDILTGRDAPSVSLGNDGDVYKRVIPIPGNVTFVEYLESSGTQYINTGIYATQDIDAIVTGDRRSGSSNVGIMLGVRTGAYSSMSKALYFGSHADSAGAISVIKTGISQSGSQANVTGVSTRRTKTLVDKAGNRTYLGMIDGSTSFLKWSKQTGEWRSDMPLCMFAFYQGTTLQTGNSTRVHRITILDRESPIADYLPCLDGNGVACMWDNIAQEYVYNDGTGDFAYGSTVSPAALDPVYYVKNNGAWEVIQQ